jgi:hypothetical protein
MTCGYAVKRPEREKTLTVFCQSDRHYRHRPYTGAPFAKLTDALLERSTIIYSRTYHYLAVQDNSRFHQPIDFFHEMIIMRYAEQLFSQGWFCGMYGNIEGAEMLFHDSFNMTVFQTRQGHIRSMKKRETVILVLEIERFSHPRGILVNKTENTVVSARHETHGFKFHAMITLTGKLEYRFLIITYHRKGDRFFRAIKHEIDLITGRVAVYFNNLITRQQTR